MPCVQFLVSGRVQGVGYRWFVVREAERLGLSGYVRNLESGDVEVVAQADAAVLDELEAALSEGPSMARVSGVVRRPYSGPAMTGFDVRY